jgi:hypothetical protein
MISEQTRRMVLERDSFTCQECGAVLERGIGKHHLHHLSYDEDKPENLISLCVSCHSKTDHSEIEESLDGKTAITVSKDTRRELKLLLLNVQAARGESLSQDDLLKILMDFYKSN